MAVGDQPAQGFPDPQRSPGDRPLAVGGALTVPQLLAAYRAGIFPWPVAQGLVTWWSPDPRAVLPLDGLHISASLGRTLRRQRMSITTNLRFADVVAGCADRPETWITPDLARAYGALHRAGYAHSIEVADRTGALAGGLYGVAVGACFSAESMFHHVTDASKIALVALIDILRTQDFHICDVQQQSAHLAAMGARSIDRATFLDRWARSVAVPAAWPPAGQWELRAASWQA